MAEPQWQMSCHFQEQGSHTTGIVLTNNRHENVQWPFVLLIFYHLKYSLCCVVSLQWQSRLGSLHEIFAIYTVYVNTEGLMSG